MPSPKLIEVECFTNKGSAKPVTTKVWINVRLIVAVEAMEIDWYMEAQKCIRVELVGGTCYFVHQSLDDFLMEIQ